LVEYLRLLASWSRRIVAAPSTTESTLRSAGSRPWQPTHETAAHSLIRMTLHANDVQSSITLLEDLPMHLLVLVCQGYAPKSIRAIAHLVVLGAFVGVVGLRRHVVYTIEIAAGIETVRLLLRIYSV